MRRDNRKNIIGALKVMDDFKIKPNYSELEREYGIDRHTIKKYHDSGGIPKRAQRKFASKWDAYQDEIEHLLNLPGVTKMGAYQFLNYKYKDSLPGNYNSMKAYTRRKQIFAKKVDTKPHVLYETDPGEQIQVDWKESLKTHTRDGTLYEYNVFSSTLGYSREHIFIYSIGKTEEDFIRCVIETFRRLGGKTKILKTDNMSAIVTVSGGARTVHERVAAFFKDIDVKLELCEVRTPQTKGKCESANRFVNWIKAFDYEVESEQELISLIEDYITTRCNQEINEMTNVPPASLFQKEKDYLRPLGNMHLLEKYLEIHKRQIVPNTLLVNCLGGRYSVPSKYIGKVVDIHVVGSEIYIYHNSTLITVHSISKGKLVNYKNTHYIEALSKRLKTNVDEIEDIATKNLNKLKKLGGDQ